MSHNDTILHAVEGKSPNSETPVLFLHPLHISKGELLLWLSSTYPFGLISLDSFYDDILSWYKLFLLKQMVSEIFLRHIFQNIKQQNLNLRKVLSSLLDHSYSAHIPSVFPTTQESLLWPDSKTEIGPFCSKG